MRDWLGGSTPWPASWRHELNEVLTQAQKGLSLNLVVVIARESDFYAELLFLLSFVGMSFAALSGVLFPSLIESSADGLMLPILGFALGSSVFALRKLYIKRVISTRVHQSVSAKAKALFYDHYQQLGTRTALVLVSELEREALMMVSPDLAPGFPTQQVEASLKSLMRHYRPSVPMPALRRGLNELAVILRGSLVASPDHLRAGQVMTQAALLIGATDRNMDSQKIVVLKGNKDIN